MTSENYKAYMQSTAWKRKKASYWKSKYPSCCYICSRPRHTGMHLHHTTYIRLGHERLSDLVPACAACHRDIHNYHARNPELSLARATDAYRAYYRKSHTVPAEYKKPVSKPKTGRAKARRTKRYTKRK